MNLLFKTTYVIAGKSQFTGCPQNFFGSPF
jgi:hypothetical protein